MRSFYLTLTVFLIVAESKAQPMAAMFRSNSLHNSYSATAGSLVFDTKQWNFFSGAPVRSTPLISEELVFIGNTAGSFFAMNKLNGQLKWKFHSGFAINSSAATQGGLVFFSDNEQTVYALQSATGKIRWKFKMGSKMDYPWRFDYYYSSPTLFDDKLIIGGDDGYLYLLDQKDGKQLWKFKTNSIIRGTPAVFNQLALVGDMDGTFYAVDIKTGKEQWNFKTIGDTLKNEDFGFDRRAILSSPVVSQDKILFGCRDGYLYCLDTKGKLLWTMDHRVSWVISTVAVKDSFVVTGTSDGRFVQAVNINTGKEIWRFQPNTLFWSSPLIMNDMVYAGGFDGQLYVLELKTGKRVSQFTTGAMILSSPVVNDGLLYVGSDDGNLYALQGHPDKRFVKNNLKRYAFYDPGSKVYFRNGADTRIKSYLENCGFKIISSDTLASILQESDANRSVIVFASDIFPQNVIANGKNAFLRRYLDQGGRIVLLGTNPIVFRIDEKTKQPAGFAVTKADTLFDIQYGYNDTRAFKGQFSNFATDKGTALGLPPFWVAHFDIDPQKVDIVLGTSENGLASSFVKKYPNGGRLVQLWINPDLPTHLDAVIKASEWMLD